MQAAAGLRPRRWFWFKDAALVYINLYTPVLRQPLALADASYMHSISNRFG